MSPDPNEARHLLQSGRYYSEARRWYMARYVRPSSDRALFLTIGVLALLVTLASLYALSGLLPLAEKPGLIVMNPQISSAVPSIYRLRQKGESVNDALRRFLVVQYVISREQYKPDKMLTDNLFVTAHSSPEVTEQYNALVGPENPRNPTALLGNSGLRLVQINEVSVRGSGEVQTATVQFSTEIVSITRLNKSQWTATVQFNYSDAAVNKTDNPESGEEEIRIEQPTFQVIRYDVAQRS